MIDAFQNISARRIVDFRGHVGKRGERSKCRDEMKREENSGHMSLRTFSMDPSSSQISTLSNEITTEENDIKTRIRAVEKKKLFTLGCMSGIGGRRFSK